MIVGMDGAETGGVLVLAGTPIGRVGDAPSRLAEELSTADVVAAEDTRRLRRLTTELGVTVSGRVGTAPNGEPMYAAAWYRKPDDSELRGYLSTASGPGWPGIQAQPSTAESVVASTYPATAGPFSAARAALMPHDPAAGGSRRPRPPSRRRPRGRA